MFANETETREEIKSKMSLVREIIILDCHSHCQRHPLGESGNLFNSILWIPVFTEMTNERQNLDQGFNNIFMGVLTS